ncbi:MAG: low molecular weight protein-tyrosine-phosphatase [Nocardioides sp.]|nr:low molecular weight protein-tyrosine-phosphatase [Nocardioides sp.]
MSASDERRGDADLYTVALVCLGNICRSPMAHVVLEDKLAAAGLADRVRVVSAGTAGWHVGKPMDPRAAATLTAAGYDATRHRARHIDDGWFDGSTERADLVLAMDASNHAGVRAMVTDDAQAVGRVRMFRQDGAEVPDPYYGGDEGFADVLAMIEDGAEAWTEEIRRTLD